MRNQKMMNLIKVFFLLFSFFVANVPLTSAVIASSNPIDEELTKMEIPKENYKIDLESENEISILQFLETSKENYYIYFYLPKMFNVQDIYKVQIGYYATNNLMELEKDNNLEIANFNLEYMGKSENKTVSKYKLNIENSEELKLFSYRRYSIRQILYRDYKGEYQQKRVIDPYDVKWKTLGDEYFYYTDLDGKRAYHYKKANYVRLIRKAAYSYLFEKTPWYDFIHPGYEKGKEYFFFGFTPNVDIDYLMEVEIMYNYQTINGQKANYFSQPYFSSDEKYPTLGEMKQADKIIMKGVESTSTSHAFYLPKSISWNKIATSEELVKNADSYFSNFMEEYFSKYKYVVTFANYSYQLDDKYLITKTTSEENVEFIEYLKANRKDYILDGTSFACQYYAYKGTYVSNIEMVRMRYETKGTEYNIQVITDPVNISGTGSGTDKVSVFDKISEYLAKLGNKLGFAWNIIEFILIVVVFALLMTILIPILKLIIYPFKKLWELIKDK